LAKVFQGRERTGGRRAFEVLANNLPLIRLFGMKHRDIGIIESIFYT
jgi:hypothetical protein